MDSRKGWVVVVAVTLVLMFTAGARLLPGIVLKPVTKEFGWSRSEIMIAITINMVFLSALQPVLGLVTDRIGPKKVFVAGTLLLGAVLFPLSQASELWHFYLLYGVVGSLAMAAVSPVNVTTLIAGWFVKQRGAALSITASGAAFGTLITVPLGTWLLTTTSWPSLYMLFGIILVFGMTPVAAIMLRPNGGNGGARRVAGARFFTSDETAPTLRLSDALAGSAFWLLAFGFFVCGFTMGFASAHFMAYADDMGMKATRAADIVAAVAVFSIGGSFLLGMAADRFPRRYVLSLTYALRGLSFALLWVLPVGPLLFIYAVVLGISWTATTPLTAAIATDLYGRANLGLIFGTMFSFMNIGFGAGSFLDGLAYDTFGNYRVALLVNAALGVLASIAVIQVNYQREPRLSGRPLLAEERLETAVAD